jgi:hypothetical protein
VARFRSQAHQKAPEKSGGLNDRFERLEGMLFGYEHWQNDWWIKARLEGRALGNATRPMSTRRKVLVDPSLHFLSARKTWAKARCRASCGTCRP